MDSKPSDHLLKHNMSWECHATHQAKYGSPGVFPVVHLAKKNLPIRSITPNNISMHVDEAPLYYQSKYCDAVMADQTPRREICYDNQAASINSHSLLDALKEISRKRIHTENEDLHTLNLKQARCGSSSAPNSTMTISEVQPVINPINASLSSARTLITYPRKGILKKKLYLPKPRTEQKHVLTQTDYQLDKKLQPKRLLHNKVPHKKVVVASQLKEVNYSTVPSEVFMPRVFDPAKFETAKKNRLAMLLVALMGKKPPEFAYKPEAKPAEQLPPIEIKPTSILSPKNKPKHDKHVSFAIPEKESRKEGIFEVPNNEVKDISGLDKPALNSAQDQIIMSSPPVSSNFSELTSSEAKAPFVIPNFPNIVKQPVVTQASDATTIVSIPPPNIPSSKVGGFKFDFKSTTEAVGTQITQSSSPQYSFTNPISSNSQLMGSSIPNMVTTNSSSSFSTNTNSFFNNESVVQPKSTQDALQVSLNTKFSSGPSQFGANTTVTSIGKNMLLSTGLGTSPSAAFSPIASSTTFNSPTSIKLNFDANQAFSPPTTTFGIKPVISSTPNPISSPSVFGSSVFPNTQNFNTNPLPVSNFNANPLPASNFNANPLPTSNFNSNPVSLSNFIANSLPTTSFNSNPLPTTNFNVNSPNTSGLAVTSIFGSAAPINKPKSVDSLPTPNTTGFNFNNSFTSPIFSNNQFKAASDSPGFADKSAQMKTNIFNNASTQNNIFGAPTSNAMVGNFTGTPTSNAMAGNFTGFNSTTPTPMYSLFPISDALALQTQSEPFTANSLSNSEVFSFGNNTAPSNNTGKFVLDGNNLFSSVPTSAFGSAVTSTLQASTTNSFSFAPSIGFNAYNTPNVEPVAPKIFSIGSGTNYPKSRAQLRGRRRNC